MLSRNTRYASHTVATPAKANNTPSTTSITEGRRSRLRRIAMDSLWSKPRFCDIPREAVLDCSLRSPRFAPDSRLVRPHSWTERRVRSLAPHHGGARSDDHLHQPREFRTGRIDDERARCDPDDYHWG